MRIDAKMFHLDSDRLSRDGTLNNKKIPWLFIASYDRRNELRRFSLSNIPLNDPSRRTRTTTRFLQLHNGNRLGIVYVYKPPYRRIALMHALPGCNYMGIGICLSRSKQE